MNVLPRRGLILSIAGFALAAVVFGTTLVDAVILEEGAAGVPPSESPLAEVRPTTPENRFSEAAEPDMTYEAFRAAVEGDPFQPSRRAPAARYELPGESIEPTSRPETPTIEPPAFRVVGSAVMATGGLALVQVDAGRPVAVGVGESVQGYRLAAVRADGATLVGPAGRLRLAITEPLVQGSNEGRGDNRAAPAAEAAQRLEEMLQQLRGARGGFQRTFQRGEGGRGGRGGRGGGTSTPEPS